MTSLAAAALALSLATAPAHAQMLAQANGNLPQGAIVNGADARLNAAEGTQPNGVPLPEGTTARDQRNATDGAQAPPKGGPPAAAEPAP